MNLELVKVLEELKVNGFEEVRKGSCWFRISDRTEIYYNNPSCRLVINVALRYIDENTVESAGIHIYKNKFVYIRYYGVNIERKMCENTSRTSLRIDMESEGEFFQESTIKDLLDIEYNSYVTIQEITSLITEWLWTHEGDI